MKYLFLACLAFVAMSFLPIQTDWSSFKLMDKVEVSMPKNTALDSAKGMPIQKGSLPDSTEFTSTSTDFTPYGLTEELLTQMADKDEFKQQLLAGMQSQGGIKVIKDQMGKFNDKYVFYDITLERDKDGKKSTVYQRMLFYKSFGITLIYKPGTKGIDEAIKSQYFNSLKITE